MSESGLDLVTGGASPPRGPGSRRADKPSGGNKSPIKWLVGLVVLAVIAVGGWLGYNWVTEQFGGPEDYTGEGSGEVVIDVPNGVGWQQVANILADADVVKSAEGFYQEALADPEQHMIQAGAYQMRLKMSAESAYKALTTDIIKADNKITIPEGARVGQVVKAIVEATEIPEADLLAALDDPTTIGLPEIANGNPEGYLFPATYTIAPGSTAVDILSQMVTKTTEVLTSLDLEARSAALGMTMEEVLTIASLLEHEARLEEDFYKVSRVIQNRLDDGMPLQLDSTVNYVSQREGDVWTTPEDRANPSEYNTYQHAGLPPGPIGSPGERAIEAALNPADGDWLYFVTVDMESGETKFATNLADHESNAEEAREYCRNSDIC